MKILEECLPYLITRCKICKYHDPPAGTCKNCDLRKLIIRVKKKIKEIS